MDALPAGLSWFDRRGDLRGHGNLGRPGSPCPPPPRARGPPAPTTPRGAAGGGPPRRSRGGLLGGGRRARRGSVAGSSAGSACSRSRPGSAPATPRWSRGPSGAQRRTPAPGQRTCPRTSPSPPPPLPRRPGGGSARSPVGETGEQILPDFVPWPSTVAGAVCLDDPSVKFLGPGSLPLRIGLALDAVDQLCGELEALCRLECEGLERECMNGAGHGLILGPSRRPCEGNSRAVGSRLALVEVAALTLVADEAVERGEQDCRRPRSFHPGSSIGIHPARPF